MSAVSARIVVPTKMHKRVRCRVREGRRLAKLYLSLCLVGGKLRGSSGQQKVQLEPWKVERVGMFAVCKHFMAQLFAFQMETQKIANFLDGLKFAGKTDGIFFSVLETTICNEFVCLHVCNDVAFATSEEFGLAAVEDITIGHISEVDKPPLRAGDAKYNNLRGVWEEAMRAEFNGVVGLNVFEFVDVVPDGVNIVRAR